jgi:hypothetical protein
MLTTVIDKEVLEQFVIDRPSTDAFEDIESHQHWNSFFLFLKSGSNVQLSADDIDLASPINLFLNTLTTGRKGTKFSLSKFKKPHKDKLPKGVDIQTLFFLNENKTKCKSLKKKNGLCFFSFDDYSKGWGKLNFDCKSSIYSVNKQDNGFKSWSIINEYVEAISDIVLIDAYIFSDSSLLESNLYRIIESLGKGLSNKVNLTIVSFSDNRNPIDIDAKYKALKAFFEREKLSITLSIVLTKQSNKQHDRAIITNYFMISSGDSFNYFNSKGEVVTKGTDIRFESFCDPKIYKLAEVKLAEVNKVVRQIEGEPDKEKYMIGDVMRNKLLNKLSNDKYE